MSEGYVYILKNEAMPGYVKIGFTQQDDVQARLKQLYTTGVPLPFECFYSARVPDCRKLEKTLHFVFDDQRPRANREFFQTNPDLVRAIIDLVAIETVAFTDEQQQITPEERGAIEAVKTRAEALTFARLGLKTGDVLTFEHEKPKTVREPGRVEVRWLQLQICPRCGWWHYQQDMGGELDGRPGQVTRATWWELTHAVQAEIDLASQTLPLEQLQQHLSRRWIDRKLISAQQAEDLVAGLLKEHHGGEVTRLTANANTADDGIDLYLSRRDDGTIQRAIQIKRRIARCHRIFPPRVYGAPRTAKPCCGPTR